MKTTELIARLTEDLKPTAKIPSLQHRLIGWIITFVLFTVVAILVLGTRANIFLALTQSRFLLETISILIAGISSGCLALYLSNPGSKTRPSVVLTLTASVFWLLSTLTAMLLQLSQGSFLEGLHLSGLVCAKELIYFSVLPAAILAALLRLGTAVSGKLTGTFVLLSAGFCGMLILQLACPSDHSVHLFLYHFIPVAALGVLGWYLGTYLCGFEARLKNKKKQILED